MPELPEVETTARRLASALTGAEVESALAPGMVALKTIDPPLAALTGRTITGTRRYGKMPVVDFSDGLSLLVHLMSAGRLQAFDKRASLRDKASRVLIRLGDASTVSHGELPEMGAVPAGERDLDRLGQIPERVPGTDDQDAPRGRPQLAGGSSGQQFDAHGQPVSRHGGSLPP